MTRYVLANPAVTASKAMAAVVIRALPGTLLIEAEPAQLEALAAALPDWLLAPETKTTRVQERTPLECMNTEALRC